MKSHLYDPFHTLLPKSFDILEVFILGIEIY